MDHPASPRAKPTLKDIARLAAASPSTVSAVLNGTWEDRRISAETAERIRDLAVRESYSANMQARGLRRGRSGLIALILPVHDNRFFSAMSQAFEAEVRRKGLCPVVVSTRRDTEEERRTVEQLLSYAIDGLVIAGASDPGALGALCREAGVGHVYVDLPGPGAPSVVGDNLGGARQLTRAILSEAHLDAGDPRGSPHFLGGRAHDFASSRRIAGWQAEVTAMTGRAPAPDQIHACGYAPRQARATAAALLDRLGGVPRALFINSTTVLEGVLAHFVTLPPEAFDGCVVGCYDYDPFAAFLQFPVHMIRQDSTGLVTRALDLLQARDGRPVIVEVPPMLVPPRTIPPSPFGDEG